MADAAHGAAGHGVAGQPLTFRHLRLWRLKAGDTFALPGGPAHGEYLRSIVAGRFDADPY